MPEFETISLEEAQLSTMSGRQGKYMQEYVRYIQQLADGQAGKLHLVGQENPTTIRKWLVLAAQALGIPLVIKRAGADLYFWIEQPSKPAGEEQPKRRRGRRPRAQQEPAPPAPPFRAPEFPASDTSPDLVAQREPEN